MATDSKDAKKKKPTAESILAEHKQVKVDEVAEKDANLKACIKMAEALLKLEDRERAKFGDYLKPVGAGYPVEVMRPAMPDHTDVEWVPENGTFHVFVIS